MLFKLLVLTLVFGLGSTSYRARERSQKLLVSLNNKCDFRQMLNDHKTSDLEVIERLRRVDDAYRSLPELGPMPRLDSFVPSKQDLESWNLANVGVNYNGAGGDEWNYMYFQDMSERKNAEIYIAQLFSNGRSRQYIFQLVFDAWSYEQEKGIRPIEPWNFGGGE